jgi:hypothetical protein
MTEDRYTFDEELAWDNITRRVQLDEHNGVWTLFGVACVNRDLSSHGVTITENARQAVDVSKMANETGPGPDTSCTYFPVGITIMPQVLIGLMEQLANEPPEGRRGDDTPEGRTA